MIPIVIVIILHEGIHALCLRLFTGEWPIVIASLEGLGGIAVRLPSWYLPRNAFLISNLAPVCTMTPVGLLLLRIAPHGYVNPLVFFNALNLAAPCRTSSRRSTSICTQPRLTSPPTGESTTTPGQRAWQGGSNSCGR